MKSLDNNSCEQTNLNSLKVPKVLCSQRSHSTLGTSVIYSPMFPHYYNKFNLFAILFIHDYEPLCGRKGTPLKHIYYHMHKEIREGEC